MDKSSVKPWIGDVEEYVPGQKIEGCVKLASNENNFGPSPKVIEALKSALGEISTYPYRGLEIKGKIASYCSVGPENIVLGNGSDEIISFIMKAFKGPVLSVSPTFSSYRIDARSQGEEYLEVPLGPDFGFDVDKFIEAADEARVLVLCNPNNPDGGVLKEEDIEKILSLRKITVVDEAYFEFYGKSSVALLKKYDNLIVLRTFAKAFGLAGLRVGYGVSSPELVGILEKVKPPFNVNILAEVAALAALDDISYMESVVEKTVSERARVFSGLPERFRVFPSETNFLLIDVAPLSAGEVYGHLLEKGVVVRKFGRFPGFTGEYVRVSIGKPEENTKFLDAMNSI